QPLTVAAPSLPFPVPIDREQDGAMNELSGQLSQLVERLENLSALDVVARAAEPVAERLTKSDAVKRALSGAPLGHRLHPLLTDLPIGCWTAATLVDTFTGRSGR